MKFLISHQRCLIRGDLQPRMKITARGLRTCNFRIKKEYKKNFREGQIFSEIFRYLGIRLKSLQVGRLTGWKEGIRHLSLVTEKREPKTDSWEWYANSRRTCKKFFARYLTFTRKIVIKH